LNWFSLRVQKSTSKKISRLKIVPATPPRWADIEELFGERGACGGCWCMFWRVPRKQYEADKGDRNKRALRKLVKSDGQPGIIAYLGKEPIGWCAVAPREQYIGLERSRILQPVDAEPVWSVSCLFVRKDYRRQGIASQLLGGAVKFARSQGARIVEGYPVDTSTNMADAFLWHGTASAFRDAGFKEVLRRSETRPIMRYAILAT